MPGTRHSVQSHIKNKRQVKEQKQPTDTLFVERGDHAKRNSEKDHNNVRTLQYSAEMKADGLYEIQEISYQCFHSVFVVCLG